MCVVRFVKGGRAFLCPSIAPTSNGRIGEKTQRTDLDYYFFFFASQLCLKC